MKLMLINILLFIFFHASGQIDYLNEIRNRNVSHLWTVDSFQIENDTIIVERPEPIGYIGDNYQRFDIHFISTIPDPENSLLYHIYGKTRVKNNICSFQGIIQIQASEILVDSDMPPLKQGWITGEYKFYEDPNDNGSGVLTGRFRSDFYIDEKGKLKYDALMFVADGFENNQFEGTWKSYNSDKIKKCNWGDFRIPDSRGLDIGAAEFSPVEEYDDYGWKNFDLWQREENWWKD